MSKVLPNGITVKSYPPFMLNPDGSEYICIKNADGELELKMEELLDICAYALTNTDITGPEDPKRKFFEEIRRMAIVNGFNPGGSRFFLPGRQT